MERGYQGTQPSENQPETGAHQAAEKRREHKCAAKEKEAAHAVGIPLLLSWFSLETADMMVQMGVASHVSAYLLTSMDRKGQSYALLEERKAFLSRRCSESALSQVKRGSGSLAKRMGAGES